jgi:SHS2 domain-containing protein
MGRWQVLESIAVADCALELEGRTLDDLFRTAAVALADTMVDPATIDAVAKRHVTLSAPSLDLLLYDWLSELIYVKDREQLIVTDARVRVRDAPPCELDARVVGGFIVPGRTACLRAGHERRLPARAAGTRERALCVGSLRSRGEGLRPSVGRGVRARDDRGRALVRAAG